MSYHLIAFAVGFCLDFLIGDPHFLPHPVRWIGSWIAWLDKRLLGDDPAALHYNPYRERKRGFLLVLFVLLPSFIIPAVLLAFFYRIGVLFGIAAEAVMTAYLFAAKSLKDESMKVYAALSAGNIPAARRALSMIVGRDTDTLDKDGIIRAAVETVSENTTDGVIAPMLYTALFGPAVGYVYKAVSTMDSMVGYTNERYKDFGMPAARLDDILAFIPARICALLMIAASAFLGEEFDAENGWRIYKRDRKAHKSPNAAQTESAAAGVLHIRLGGDAFYFGKKERKPYIGDDDRTPQNDDIVLVNRLMQRTAFLGAVLCLLIMLIE